MNSTFCFKRIDEINRNESFVFLSLFVIFFPFYSYANFYLHTGNAVVQSLIGYAWVLSIIILGIPVSIMFFIQDKILFVPTSKYQ